MRSQPWATGPGSGLCVGQSSEPMTNSNRSAKPKQPSPCRATSWRFEVTTPSGNPASCSAASASRVPGNRRTMSSWMAALYSRYTSTSSSCAASSSVKSHICVTSGWPTFAIRRPSGMRSPNTFRVA